LTKLQPAIQQLIFSPTLYMVEYENFAIFEQYLAMCWKRCETLTRWEDIRGPEEK